MARDWSDLGIDTRGHYQGEIKTLCPKCSPTRKKSKYPCLSVNLDKGVFHCWHCDWSGSLTHGEEQRPLPPMKRYRAPSAPAPVHKPGLQEWFQARGIPWSVVQRRGITLTRVYFPQIEDEADAIAFPYYRDSVLINVKYRTLREKYFRMAPQAERILYGFDQIQGETLIWCEGEMDALALETAGFHSVVSVPDGAPSPETKNYAAKFDYLESAESALTWVRRHIIAVDNDAPGHALARELARRLGPEKCYQVTWASECKDANDVLMSYGAEVLKECLDNAEPWPVEGIITPASLLSTVLKLYDQGRPKTISTGWPTVDPYYTVVPGQWTLVQGIPSHGKSVLTSALAIQLADKTGWRFAVCSPEWQPVEDYHAWLLQLITGAPFFEGPTRRMSRQEVIDATAWLHARVAFLLPSDHTPTIDEVLELARVEVFRHGIQGLVIDPYNELEHSRPAGLTETEYISQFISKLRFFARRHQVHVWLIVHPTKLQPREDGTYPVPKPYDSAGSAHWYNKADNVLTIYRDVKADNNRIQLHSQKIRFRYAGKPGMVELYYHQATGRFSDISRER